MIPKGVYDLLIFSFQSSLVHLRLGWTVNLYDFDVPLTLPFVLPIGHGVLHWPVYQHG